MGENTTRIGWGNDFRISNKNTNQHKPRSMTLWHTCQCQQLCSCCLLLCFLAFCEKIWQDMDRCDPSSVRKVRVTVAVLEAPKVFWILHTEDTNWIWVQLATNTFAHLIVFEHVSVFFFKWVKRVGLETNYEHFRISRSSVFRIPTFLWNSLHRLRAERVRIRELFFFQYIFGIPAATKK